MKKLCVLIMTVGVFLGCASGVKAPAVSGLVSLDDALAGAVTEVSSKVQGKTEIVIAAIDTSLLGVSEFLSDELAGLLVSSGKFVILERGPALDALTAEHGVQMSGLVSDESAVGIGHYLGAKVVLTGTFNRFADFSQIRVRALDVRTSEILTLYTVRILPNDRVLQNIMRPEDQNILAQAVTEDAIAYLNRGVDLYNEGKYEEAIEEFNKALAINANLAEAYYHRGNAYQEMCSDLLEDEAVEFVNKAIADYNSAIAIKPDFADALFNRGYLYRGYDYDKALEDYAAVLRIKPDHLDTLYMRADLYSRFKKDPVKAIADYTAILRVEPNNVHALFNRAVDYAATNNFAAAIADYEAVIRINTRSGLSSEAKKRIDTLRQRQ